MNIYQISMKTLGVGYFLEVDVEYPKSLWSSRKHLPFLTERKKFEKVEKLFVV